jgi:hypothetical protein
MSIRDSVGHIFLPRYRPIYSSLRSKDEAVPRRSSEFRDDKEIGEIGHIPQGCEGNAEKEICPTESLTGRDLLDRT